MSYFGGRHAFDPGEAYAKSLAVTYAEEVEQQEHEQAVRHADNIGLENIKAYVWKEHCAYVVPERVRAWEIVMYWMRSTKPNPTSRQDMQKFWEANWSFNTYPYPDDSSNVVMQTDIAAVAPSKAFSAPISEAIEYLQEPKRGKNCPDALLGIQAMSRGPGSRRIPLQPLEQAVDTARTTIIANRAHMLRVAVTASVYGSEVPGKRLIDTTVEKRWHDDPKPPDNFGIDYADFATWELGRDPASLPTDGLYKYFVRKTQIHDENYQQLQAAGSILMNPNTIPGRFA
jgi:hypothetical protein